MCSANTKPSPLVAVSWPAEPIGVGATWTVVTNSDGFASGATTTTTTKYRIEATNSGEIKLDVAREAVTGQQPEESGDKVNRIVVTYNVIAVVHLDRPLAGWNGELVDPKDSTLSFSDGVASVLQIRTLKRSARPVPST